MLHIFLPPPSPLSTITRRGGVASNPIFRWSPPVQRQMFFCLRFISLAHHPVVVVVLVVVLELSRLSWQLSMQSEVRVVTSSADQEEEEVESFACSLILDELKNPQNSWPRLFSASLNLLRETIMGIVACHRIVSSSWPHYNRRRLHLLLLLLLLALLSCKWR